MSFMFIFCMSDIEVRLNLFSLCAILPKNVIFSSHKSIVVGRRYSAKIKTLIVVLVNIIFSERHAFAFVSHYFFYHSFRQDTIKFYGKYHVSGGEFQTFFILSRRQELFCSFFSKLDLRVCFG